MNVSNNSEMNQATEATLAFVVVLRAEGLLFLAEKFEQIAQALKNCDIAAAVHLFRQMHYTGPGSLSDVYAKDELTFNAAWGACCSALRKIECPT
ncbi:MAG: hypothetical protein ACKOF9_00750 [Burkholderiales bacterium]